MRFKILKKVTLSDSTFWLKVEAARIAKKCRPGQFVIIRLNDTGERIPLTIVDRDLSEGSIALYVKIAGKTTALLGSKSAGDEILDVAGPLGTPSPLENYGTAVCVGGGIGVAAIYPIAKGLKEAGNRVIGLIGADRAQHCILEEEMRGVCDKLLIATDDGSKGHRGFVTELLKNLIDSGEKIDYVIAIGPLPMMKAAANVTKPSGIKTSVSLNPIMVDGSGMCGGCRVSVGGETKFACVDGPEFDGHKVDFEGLSRRLAAYRDYEEAATNSCRSIPR